MSRNLNKATDRKSQADCYFVSRDGVDVCPCCGKKLNQANTRRHHAREHIEGGLSIRWNVIAICASCHVVIHGGTKEDVFALNQKARHVLVSRFGLLNLLQYPIWRDYLRMTKPTNLEQIKVINREIKKVFADIGPMDYSEAQTTDVESSMFLAVLFTKDKLMPESA